MNQQPSLRLKFDLGQIVATPGAVNALRAAGDSPNEFLRRHVRGDWGDLDTEDRALNDAALLDGTRVLSAYVTARGVKLWVITEAAGDDGRRVSTTLLLPEDY